MNRSLLAKLVAGIALLIVSLFAMNGCAGSSGAIGSGGTGTLVMHMSDGSGTGITAVNITITRIDANIDGSWQTVSTTPQTINLLDLVQTDTTIATAVLPAGNYTQVRFIVSSGTVTDGTGTHPLIIPSGLQTGIKVNLDFTIPANQIVGILLDFNVAQSIVVEGNGTYRLHPVIPGVIQVLSGTITGTVSDASGIVNGATVTATYTAGTNYPIGTVVNTTATISDGTFKIWALLPGTYTLTFTFTNASNVVETATVTGVVVTANTNTDVGSVVLQ